MLGRPLHLDLGGRRRAPCAPFRCGSAGVCLDTCATSADCAAGASCDLDTKSCVSAAPTDAGGGCAVAHVSPSPLGLAGALGLASLVSAALRRRRAT
ncbi:MAG: hypothetical protein IPJ34_06995 [Myxococcales bacterium]|nr:hypothetical protein [Myxococcales bacterium]